MDMNTPKMILFDYGHTLLCEPGHDMLRGAEALYQHIKSNKHGLTPKQINDFSQELWLASLETVRETGFELHERQFQRFLHEYLEIELSVSFEEAENILWDGASAGALMPNVDKALAYIREKGIRSGVISNMGFSGAALARRIHRLLPHNQFEFILASSEYMFRKPSPLLFELALKKAGLSAGEVWFCGDSIRADVEGAAAVGIFPVWYEDETLENPWRAQEQGERPRCAHLHIHDWLELIDALGKTD